MFGAELDADEKQHAGIESIAKMMSAVSTNKSVTSKGIIGRRKFPSTFGIDGMRKNQTITTPWNVNSLL